MKDVTCQYKGNLYPYSEEDAEELAAEFKFNQLVRCRVTKISKVLEPSVLQNNLLHKCFELVGENSRNPNIKNKDQAKFACKVALDFRHKDRVAVRPDGTVVFEYRSFSFDALKDMERLNIFELAFAWCALELETDVDTLIENAKERMGPQGKLVPPLHG